MKNSTRIVTHGGKFHADDIIACAILRLIYPGIEIIRTLLSAESWNFDVNDIIVDVGRIYNPKINRYDHHQKDGPIRPYNKIPYAACGLIWAHYGMYLIGQIAEMEGKDISGKIVSKVWSQIDDEIISVIDLMDNGLLKSIEDSPVKGITIPAMINAFVPHKATAEEMDMAFETPLKMMMEFLFCHIERSIAAAESFEKVRKATQIALENTEQKFVVIDEPGAWRKAVLETDKNENILYAIYEDEIRDQWMIQCVPQSEHSFNSRKPFPEILCGKDEKFLLQQYKGLKFVHNTGFIAALRTQDDAISFASVMATL